MEDDPKPIPSKQASDSDKELRRDRPSAPQQSGLGGLWSELKRRHVVRVAMVYAIVGWLVIQVANATFADFGIPVWAYRFVVLMVVLGFPISLVVAWAFELTPEGIKTSKTARETHPEAHKDVSHAKKRNWFFLGLGYALVPILWGDPEPPDSPDSGEVAESSPGFPENLDYSLLESDPATEFLSEDERNQLYAKLGNIVDPVVSEILFELELRDYQIEPMKQEIRTLFVGRFMLLNIGRIEVRKADENVTKRRNAIDDVNDKLAALYSRVKKNVRKVLERKQFKKYNRLIDEIAPPSVRRRGSIEDGVWDEVWPKSNGDNPDNPTTQRSILGSSRDGSIR